MSAPCPNTGARARRLAEFGSWTALAMCLLVGCQSSIKPAKAEFVDRLERPENPEARQQLDLAERDLASGEWKQALSRLEVLCPENAACSRIAILARRAVTLAPQGERPRLRTAVLERIRTEASKTTDKTELASLAFGEALFAGTVREEEQSLRRALELAPNHYYALAKLGECYFGRGELEASRTVLEKAVSLRPDLAEGWLLLAQVAEDRGNYKQAVNHYETYLGLRPLDRRVQLEYARLLAQKLRDGKRAEATLAKLRQEDPSNLEVGLDLGFALYLQGRHRDAERLYHEMLERWPREPRLLLSLGNLYFGALDEPVKALQTYRWMLAQRSGDDLLAMLGQALFVPARIRQIEEQLQKGGKAAPAPPKSLSDLMTTWSGRSS
ncbi:MAG: tetratricopeptide repeat protein [Planctomycetes bacterium]|nr:tetratricopeptide repeat protein [Planctomycetota bacterium]